MWQRYFIELGCDICFVTHWHISCHTVSCNVIQGDSDNVSWRKYDTHLIRNLFTWTLFPDCIGELLPFLALQHVTDVNSQMHCLFATVSRDDDSLEETFDTFKPICVDLVQQFLIQDGISNLIYLSHHGLFFVVNPRKNVHVLICEYLTPNTRKKLTSCSC